MAMTSSTLTRKAFVIGVSSFGAGLRPLDRAVDHARDFGELLQASTRRPSGRGCVSMAIVALAP